MQTYIEVAEGTEAIHRILALQTPLHEITLGSGCKLSTQTWPTYPSLLHTHTSLKLHAFSPKAGEAQVNCKPARVLRIGTVATNSGHGRCSELSAVSATHQNKKIIDGFSSGKRNKLPNLCLASLKDSSQVVRFSVVPNITDMSSSFLID